MDIYPNLYPLKFQPIFKSVIWGGDEIYRFKNLPAAGTDIGESWEISGLSGDVSIVSNGELGGTPLDRLIERYGAALLGQEVLKRCGATFPLLIKFIDARQPLSIQVHPDDALARQRHQALGKTEMWYVIKTAPGACLYSGFRQQLDAEKYVRSLADNTFMNYLQKHEVQAGDVFFLPAGRVHAIGAGCFIAEIQQTSNITYRIYDYNRRDAGGNYRELHTELARDAIDYRVYANYKLQCAHNENPVRELVRCPWFTTSLLTEKAGATIKRAHEDRFVIYICLAGQVELTDATGHTVSLRQGETVLTPASGAGAVRLRFQEKSDLLETFAFMETEYNPDGDT